jgi:hypothetical protein
MPVLGEGRKGSRKMQEESSRVAGDAAWLSAIESGEERSTSAVRRVRLSRSSWEPSLGLFSTCANPIAQRMAASVAKPFGHRSLKDKWSCSAAVPLRRSNRGAARIGGQTQSIRRPPASCSSGSGDAGAGLDHLRAVAPGAGSAAGAGRRSAGQLAGAPAGCSEEHLVTRALACNGTAPVLPLDFHDPEAMAPGAAAAFRRRLCGLPLRVAAGQILYLGFEDRLDPVVALAIERMTGLRVEAGWCAARCFSRRTGACWRRHFRGRADRDHLRAPLVGVSEGRRTRPAGASRSWCVCTTACGCDVDAAADRPLVPARSEWKMSSVRWLGFALVPLRHLDRQRSVSKKNLLVEIKRANFAPQGWERSADNRKTEVEA